MRDEGVGFTSSCTLHTFPTPSFLSAMIHAAPNASAFSPAHKGGFSRCAARFRRPDARFPLIPPTPFSHKERRARWIETALRDIHGIIAARRVVEDGRSGRWSEAAPALSMPNHAYTGRPNALKQAA